MHVWKNQAIVDNFLTNTRKAIPLGGEQLDILLRLISKSQPIVNNFIDLGCGDGILAGYSINHTPTATLVGGSNVPNKYAADSLMVPEPFLYQRPNTCSCSDLSACKVKSASDKCQ